MDLAWQTSLLGHAEPAIDHEFEGLIRHQLDNDSWIDVVPDWLRGADEVFAALVAHAPWTQHERVMWGNKVMEPRLTTGWKTARVAEVVPVLLKARAALTRRYGFAFNSGWLNLYRDGHDSVAWHRDRIPKSNPFPYVGILTLGAQRKFLVRPHGGGPSIEFRPGPGDLLVTGGLMQRQWEHCVPKTKQSGPRISVTFRHIHDD